MAPALQSGGAGIQQQAAGPGRAGDPVGEVVERSLIVRVGAATGATALVAAAFLWFGGVPSNAGARSPRAYYTASGTRLPAVPPAPSSVAGPLDELLEGETRTALQGDEVSEALATYGIDGAGNLYEVHSPETEVPKLGRPTT